VEFTLRAASGSKLHVPPRLGDPPKGSSAGYRTHSGLRLPVSPITHTHSLPHSSSNYLLFVYTHSLPYCVFTARHPVYSVPLSGFGGRSRRTSHSLFIATDVTTTAHCYSRLTQRYNQVTFTHAAVRWSQMQETTAAYLLRHHRLCSRYHHRSHQPTRR
jgi:hypothetical protein